MRFVILTGLSGAGKTTGLHALEDLGYFTADNLPPALWPALIEQARPYAEKGLVVGVDVRTRAFLADIKEQLADLRGAGVNPEIVFLDASNEVLVKRYNLTRRTHPLGHTLSSDIAAERETLGSLRALADVVLDTSSFTPARLVEELWTRFAEGRQFRLRLLSFGFKRGVPIDADNVFDLRALPNPYYDPRLKVKDGRDPDVQAYIFTPEGLAFYADLCSFVHKLTALALGSGRSSYTIALGCTGGQHRSVAIVERLQHDLAHRYSIQLEHRDVTQALAEHGGPHGAP